MTDQEPKRRKRPADFAQRAKMIIDIATGKIQDREPTRRAAEADYAQNMRFKNVSPALRTAFRPGNRRDAPISVSWAAEKD
jgi:hypothetical protein